MAHDNEETVMMERRTFGGSAGGSVGLARPGAD
jgi:hypothetical protein